MRRVLAGAVVAVPLGVLGVAHAQGPPLITIPVDTVVYTTPGGSAKLGEAGVSPGDTGKSCMVEVDTTNQESTHPGTNIEVRSNGSSVSVLDVEDGSFATHQGFGQLVLGSRVEVWVHTGSDVIWFGGEAHGVFSGGGTVTIDCASSQPVVVSPVEVHRPAPAPDVAARPAQGSTEPSALGNPATAVSARAVTAAPRFTG
jgi:hypothetical protein